MDSGISRANQRFLFRNESSAVTRIEAKKSPIRLASKSEAVSTPTKSTVLVEDYKFTWGIENFCWIADDLPLTNGSDGLDMQSAIKSPVFATGGNSKCETFTQWALLLHPSFHQISRSTKTGRFQQNTFVGLHLQMEDPSEEVLQVVFVLSIVTANGERVHSKENRAVVIGGRLCEQKVELIPALGLGSRLCGSRGGCSGWPDFLPRKTLNDARVIYLPNNTLTVRCDMVVYYHPMPVSTIVSEKSALKCTNALDLARDVRAFYKCQKHCDILLTNGNTEVWAHKSVLSARSQTFAAIFEIENADAYYSSFEIADVSTPVMSILLDFIYGANVETLLTPEISLDVFYGADKYKLPVLKRMCIKIMMQNLTVQNVCQVACLADQLYDQEMLAKVKKFVNSNASKILVSPHWLKMVQKRPELAAYIARE